MRSRKIDAARTSQQDLFAAYRRPTQQGGRALSRAAPFDCWVEHLGVLDLRWWITPVRTSLAACSVGQALRAAPLRSAPPGDTPLRAPLFGWRRDGGTSPAFDEPAARRTKELINRHRRSLAPRDLMICPLQGVWHFPWAWRPNRFVPCWGADRHKRLLPDADRTYPARSERLSLELAP